MAVSGPPGVNKISAARQSGVLPGVGPIVQPPGLSRIYHWRAPPLERLCVHTRPGFFPELPLIARRQTLGRGTARPIYCVLWNLETGDSAGFEGEMISRGELVAALRQTVCVDCTDCIIWLSDKIRADPGRRCLHACVQFNYKLRLIA